jgi:hypothetical protein
MDGVRVREREREESIRESSDEAPKWKLNASAWLVDPLNPPTTSMLSPSGLTTAECRCLADGITAPGASTRSHVLEPASARAHRAHC